MDVSPLHSFHSPREAAPTPEPFGLSLSKPGHSRPVVAALRQAQGERGEGRAAHDVDLRLGPNPFGLSLSKPGHARPVVTAHRQAQGERGRGKGRAAHNVDQKKYVTPRLKLRGSEGDTTLALIAPS